MVSLDHVSEFLYIGVVIKAFVQILLGSDIRMVLFGKLSVGVLDLLWGGSGRNLQNPVVIFLLHLGSHIASERPNRASCKSKLERSITGEQGGGSDE